MTNVDLKDTLNLPKTDFPMKADLVEREPKRQAHWDAMKLYERILEKHQNDPLFVLHDGPPYTNGDIHVGTAFNKILKDTLVRYKSLRGFKAPFVPGWDCHGLPIEHKVCRDLEEQKKTLPTAELRQACAAFSARYRDHQTKQFQRLGVLGDWENPYQTMSPTYEADILRAFSILVDKGHIYRSKKPVYWSIPCKTALAEGEVEYQDVVSPSIYVAFPVADPSKIGLNGPLNIVIWTTTPWTLVANLAIAAHAELTYILLEHSGTQYLVAEKLADELIAACKWENVIKKQTFLGKDLEGLQAQHPFINRSSPVVLAPYVLDNTGTGFVHTAPGHGLDDYLTGLKYGLEIYSPVGDDGCYINDGQVPAAFVGLSVLMKNGQSKANQAVFAALQEKGALLSQGTLTHSYPHCWRSKTPVIVRATDQWFISLENNNLREKALAAIGNVKWTPANGENRIRGAVENRPDWCITRQRAWGTPFIVFYDEEGKAYLDGTVIRALADKFEKEGSDLWFSANAEELLSAIEVPSHWKGKKLRTGTDTLDVWIDSGVSHYAVLKRRPELRWPADLYLEGSDQHRGWFNSSLWTAMMTDGTPPYRQVLTHGFIVNEDNRQKISKSGNKPQTATEYVGRFGADVLRLWVASEDYQSDVPLSETILAQVTQVYRTIRNTLRFLLGNLYDFDSTKDTIYSSSLTPLDQWALSETKRLIDEVTAAYDAYAFHRAYQLLSRFVTVTLSATYHDILKDRLYVLAPNDPTRRSSQTAMHCILHALLKLLSPILVHTADEAFSYAIGNQDVLENNSIHLQDWPSLPEKAFDEQIAKEVKMIIDFRETVHAALEPLRKSKAIGQSSDAAITIVANPLEPLWAVFKKYEAQLPEFFIVSYVTLKEEKDAAPRVEAATAQGFRCPRSWKWVPALVPCEGYPDMSPRSRDALLASR